MIEATEAANTIRDKIADIIRKDGEGRPILGKTYFEETGKRLWEPVLTSFKKSGYATRKCPDIYHMDKLKDRLTHIILEEK